MPHAGGGSEEWDEDEALRHVFAAVAQAERFVMALGRAETEGSPANAKLTT